MRNGLILAMLNVEHGGFNVRSNFMTINERNCERT